MTAKNIFKGEEYNLNFGGLTEKSGFMYDGPVYIKTFQFSKEIVQLYNEMKESYNIMADQLLKASTSIGANVREASSAQSKADFISKMSIALKEAKESRYWLRLIDESNLIGRNLTDIIDLNVEIIRILTAIIKTTQQNLLKKDSRDQ